nr:hypothetical protein [Rhodococcus sp. 14-2470-1a]
MSGDDALAVPTRGRPNPGAAFREDRTQPAYPDRLFMAGHDRSADLVVPGRVEDRMATVTRRP